MTGSIVPRPERESRQDRRRAVLRTVRRRQALTRHRRVASLWTVGLLRSVADHAVVRHHSD